MTGREDRARGALVGLAIGDALGAPVEFEPPDRITGRRGELFAMPGGGPFGWAPGEFTDDTQMALILAGHLVRGPLDQDALAREFAAWATPPATADVGMQTRRVLSAVAAGQAWRVAIQQLDEEAAGNGSLMRTAPAALAGESLDTVISVARRQSEITHPNRWCVDACAVFSAAIRLTIESGSLPELQEVAELASEPEVRDAIESAMGSGAPLMTGFVLHTLTAALWAVYGAAKFDDAVWRAVSRGGDADTVGAIAGSLAGAHWGRGAIDSDLVGRLSTSHPMFDEAYPAAFDAMIELFV